MASLKQQRPPKPDPRPFGGPSIRSIHEEADSRSMDENNIGMHVSQVSRRSLRREIARRRLSLTPQESTFLEELCIHGNEIEVQLATKTLKDSEIFFDDSETAEGWDKQEGFSVGREVSSNSVLIPKEVLLTDEKYESSANLRETSMTSSGSGIGSERRQMMLTVRRESQKNLFGVLWKAHEKGVPISQTGPRRNGLTRHASMANKVFRSVRNDELFRSFRVADKAPMLDIRSDNHRNGRSSSFKIPLRPQLRRIESDSSRKSVTFGRLPSQRRSVRAMSEGGAAVSRIPFLRKAAPLRSDSTSSIPSIHLAHPVQSPSLFVRSNGRSDSVSSVPSIHWSHPVRSNSMLSVSSIPSLRRAYPIRTESYRSEATSAVSSLGEPSWAEEEKVEPAWTSPIPTKVELNEEDMLLEHIQRPVLLRDASENFYNGEGIEVADWDADRSNARDPINVARRFESLVSFNDGASVVSLRSCTSFDETISYERVSNIFRRTIRRTLSDDSTSLLMGGVRYYDKEASSTRSVLVPGNDESSWNMDSDGDLDHYDSWKVLEDEYVNGYGGGGTLPFLILGTSADDVDAHPHVLSPPLMDSLQAFMPQIIMGDNFWMKYSLVRDGASWHTFLKYARGAKYTILAIETVDGEVFGAFTSQPWRKSWNYFGGADSFLWRMRQSRKEKTHSILDQAQIETEIEVFPYTGENECIQLCTQDKVAVGGGTGDSAHTMVSDLPIKESEWGFGLTVQSDMIHGTSSPCLTFGSPSLSHEHSDGSIFEVVNLELWTLTPCTRLDDAEKLELGMLFLEEHRNQ